ncbi:hypothetical protein GCM10010399_01450 [Dactylosporangium fulvum]|uniref:Antibiotic biosynthesis monooxygenase n=1 Tax=Dactylosporangium fulvum TaxID=53359 RepID=A0ABY5VPM6_9ACTN|nr:hypothetical protein [Dactylosporangium fulvum]UWP79702.1 hypothetical protein Dfulv_31655 [Dactylosporangium fulvum]
MALLMIRYQIADEGIADVVEAVENAFAAVAEAQPDGIRYLYLHAADTSEFIALLELADGVENPLPGIAAARHLQATVAKWSVGAAPTPRPLAVLGAYRAFG